MPVVSAYQACPPALKVSEGMTRASVYLPEEGSEIDAFRATTPPVRSKMGAFASRSAFPSDAFLHTRRTIRLPER